MRVVFIFNEYSLHNHVLESYGAARPGDDVSLVKLPLVLKGKGRGETAARILPRLSRRFAAGKATEFGALLALTLMPKLMGRGPVFRRLRSIAKRHGLPFLETDDVMSLECLEFIRAQRPEVVVTLMHQIIKEPLIGLAPLGVVNVHPGLIPEFRGIQPYFRALSEGTRVTGCSLHLITDATVDTGPLLARAVLPVRRGMSVQRAYYETCRAAGRLLPRCLAALEEGRLRPAAQDATRGAYFRWPDTDAFDRLRKRGHRLIGWRDLFAILRGHADDPRSEEWLATGDGQAPSGSA